MAGTVNALVAAYLDPQSTSPFKTGAAETQRTRRNILENFRAAHGDLPIYRTETTGSGRCCSRASTCSRSSTRKREHRSRSAISSTRCAHMFQWAPTEGRVPDDPTLGVTRVKAKTTGYKTWSEDHIARFEATHAIGTRARLAFALLLYTGQRRGDVVKIGRQHVSVAC